VAAVIAFGQTITVALGDFDMSQGSTVSMVGMITGGLMANHHLAWSWAVIIGLLIGCVAGMFNGLLVSYFNLHPFITTMGTLTAFQGVAYLATDGTIVSGFPKGYLALGQENIGPIPILIVVMAVIFLLCYFVMERTALGRRWYALGGNYDASYLAGLRVRRLRFLGFVVSGVLAALAGLMLGARLGGDTPQMGAALILNAIAAVFLGLTAFGEGLPNIRGTLVGVLLLGVLINGLAVNSVNPYYQELVTGAVVIGAIALAGITKRQRA